MYEELVKKMEAALGPEIVKDLREQIAKIENSIPTTQNHYGDYMAILSGFGGNKAKAAEIFIILGANRIGVENALKFV